MAVCPRGAHGRPGTLLTPSATVCAMDGARPRRQAGLRPGGARGRRAAVPRAVGGARTRHQPRLRRGPGIPLLDRADGRDRVPDDVLLGIGCRRSSCIKSIHEVFTRDTSTPPPPDPGRRAGPHAVQRRRRRGCPPPDHAPRRAGLRRAAAPIRAGRPRHGLAAIAAGAHPLSAYLRGAPGVIESVHAPRPILDVYETEAGREVPQAWYTVAFEWSDLWDDPGTGHVVLVDLWETHLEA